MKKSFVSVLLPWVLSSSSAQAGLFKHPVAPVAPDYLEACFTPDEACDEKLVALIKNAKQSIDMAIYDINLDELVHQLLVQSKSIPVRLVVDRRQSKGQHSLVSLLIKGGVEVRFGHQRGIMHNKFTIVDESILELGSFNYTHHASRANQENQLYLSAPKIVERYRERFEKMWKRADPATP